MDTNGEKDSVKLRREAEAFRSYGASPEAQECEDLAARFEKLEAEIDQLLTVIERSVLAIDTARDYVEGTEIAREMLTKELKQGGRR